MSHQIDALRRAIAAVGAAHQHFTTNADLKFKDQQSLPDAGLHLYNRAITAIVTDSSLQTEIVLLCCLLFICFESMMGRYAESVKHFRAGVRLLGGTEQPHPSTLSYAAKNIFDMYTRLGKELGVFIGEGLTPRRELLQWVAPPRDTNLKPRPFNNLTDAVDSLKQLDLEFSNAFAQPAPVTVSSYAPQPSESFANRLKSSPVSDVLERVRLWSAQLDVTLAKLALGEVPVGDQKQIDRLRLSQSIWGINFQLGGDRQDAAGFDKACEKLLHYAEIRSQDIKKLKRRTFSMEGELVSGLSFLVRIAWDRDAHARACELLKSLNRREGVWDSKELFDMHQAALSQPQPRVFYGTWLGKGVANFAQAVYASSGLIDSGNSLLNMKTN